MSEKTTSPIDLAALMERCHAGSKAKGFWDPKPNAGQQLMLAIGELAEAQEAHRQDHANLSGLKAYDHLVLEAEAGGSDLWGALANTLEERKLQLFKWKVKDSVADELGDCYIRLLDFAAGFSVATPEFIADYRDNVNRRANITTTLPENFGGALLHITRVIGECGGAFASINISVALARIEQLAERMDIDLFRHIDLKLTYNASRPHKHGKGY